MACLFFVPCWAMDDAQDGMRIRRISDGEFEARRAAKARALQARPLFKKRPEQLEQEQLFMGQNLFKGVIVQQPVYGDRDRFELHVRQGNAKGVVGMLGGDQNQLVRTCPLARNFFDIATNRTNVLYFDPSQNPNISPEQAVRIAVPLAKAGGNEGFLEMYKTRFLAYQEPHSWDRSSSSSSGEDGWTDDSSDDF